MRESPIFRPLLAAAALVSLSACGKSGNDAMLEGGAQPEATANDIAIDNGMLERDMAFALRSWNVEGSGAPVVRVNADGTTTVIDADMARVPAANQDADNISVAALGACYPKIGGKFMNRTTDGQACETPAGSAVRGRVNPDGSMSVSYSASPNPMFTIQHNLTIRPDGENCGSAHFNRVATSTGRHGVLEGTNEALRGAVTVRTEGDYRVCYTDASGWTFSAPGSGRR